MVTIKQVQAEGKAFVKDCDTQIKALRDKIAQLQQAKKACRLAVAQKCEQLRLERKDKAQSKAEAKQANAEKREQREAAKAKAAVEFLLKYKAKLDAKRPQLAIAAE